MTSVITSLVRIAVASLVLSGLSACGNMQPPKTDYYSYTPDGTQTVIAAPGIQDF